VITNEKPSATGQKLHNELQGPCFINKESHRSAEIIVYILEISDRRAKSLLRSSDTSTFDASHHVLFERPTLYLLRACSSWLKPWSAT